MDCTAIATSITAFVSVQYTACLGIAALIMQQAFSYEQYEYWVIQLDVRIFLSQLHMHASCCCCALRVSSVYALQGEKWLLWAESCWEAMA